MKSDRVKPEIDIVFSEKIREILCEYSDCPDGGCGQCVLDTEETYKEYLQEQLKSDADDIVNANKKV